MTTEEIANEILDAWYHEVRSCRPYERCDSSGYKKVCEAIERLKLEIEEKDRLLAAAHRKLAEQFSPLSMTLADELIRLLREQLLVCSRILLTRREGYQIDYAKMSNYLAALQAIDELEKMPAVQDASIPF